MPFFAWLLISSRSYGRAVATTTAGLTHAPQATFGGQLAYALGDLPAAARLHAAEFDSYPLWRVFFQGLVGRFGYFEYDFSNRVDYFALAIALAVLVLAGTALVRYRVTVGQRALELLCYVTLAAGTALVIAVAGYHYTLSTAHGFEQTRYLFPLLPLYAALFALAVRGAGRRFGPPLAVVLAFVIVGQEVFSLLLTLQRYYTV